MSKKLIILCLFLVILIPILPAQDSANANLESLQRLDEHEKRIDAIQTDLDYVWVILCAGLVFFMQAGFMSLEAGMARSKNSINVSIKNLTDFVLGVIGFWVIGFGIMFGKSWMGFWGTSDFMISIENPWTAAFFMFQSVFVGTAATIDSGAVCERAKLKQYILLSFLLSTIIYPIFGHWVWGSFLHGSDTATGAGMGWLEARGFKDFAGSSVVHSVGGWMALAGTIVVGPRIGKFLIDPKTGKNGKPQKIYPGDMRFVFLGVFILFFGWFGFNCGSTLAATPDIACIALNTTLSACFGCLVSSLLSWLTHPEKKIEGEMIANGILGGLVGITAGCAFVDAGSSAIIGIISGFVVFYGDKLLQEVLKLDDVVSAVPVHGFCGVWGTLAVGFFIKPNLLDGMTRLDQIKIQSLGALVCFVWAFGLGLIFYFLVDKLAGGVRVSKEEEMIGLNVAEHGARSTLIELANTVNDLTLSGNFEDHQGIDVDQGTEAGDLANLFNKMIFKISHALKESREQKLLAEEMLNESRRQHNLAKEAENNLKQTQEESRNIQNTLISQAQEMISNVIDKADTIYGKMTETTGITQNMYESFTALTSTLGTMLTSLSEVNNKIRNVNQVTTTATSTGKQTTITVNELKKTTSEISAMVDFVNEIAERTHLLSINSAIEASKSGEEGKGFSVISKEVQKLSQETSKAVVNIGEKVKRIDTRITNVTDSIESILTTVVQISELNIEILRIIENNENLTHDLSTQSTETLTAVEAVNSDIAHVVTGVNEVTEIGNKVKAGLQDIGNS